MQAKIMELEASLVTATSAQQQLSTQQAVDSAPKPPKPPKPDKIQIDRRSGAASNWLHHMTLYLTLSGLLGTAQAVPHAVSFLIGAARTWWRTRGLKPQIRLHLELQRPSTVNDAMRLAQAADSALYYTRPTYHINRPTPSPPYWDHNPCNWVP